MKLEKYSVFGGPERECLRVNWADLPKGFFVRRYTQRGLCSGHLTNGGGWGILRWAKVFATPQEAVQAAIRKGCRIFIIVQNVNERRRK